MKGKKFLLMLTLVSLVGAIIGSSIPPATASEAIPVKVYVKPEFPGYIPGTTDATLEVEVWIDTPTWIDNTVNGTVGYSFGVHVNPAVLQPLFVTGASGGYWLYDFCFSNGYYSNLPQLLPGTKNTSDWPDIAEYIQGWETLLKGAGGSGKLCTLTFVVLSETAYTKIDLYNVHYYNTTGGASGKVPVDVVVDGHYNQYTGYSFLHSTSGLINLSAPLATTWHELYPTYCTNTEIDEWVDTGGDGKLSRCDFIMLNTTDWYHVEEVTVTIVITDVAKGKTYTHYLEFVGWEEYMNEAIASPADTTWHEVYGEWTGGGADPSHEFCHQFNITGYTDNDASGNLTALDDITLDHTVGDPGPDWEVSEVSTDIIITGPVPEPPEFPLGAALEVSLIVAIVYVLWRSRRKTKITKQAKLAY